MGAVSFLHGIGVCWPWARVAARAVTLHAAPGGAEVAPPAGAAGCEVALEFDAIYERYFDFVWRNVRRLGVPDCNADDAVQEVFLVVHRKLSSFEPRSTLRAWLSGIVAHVAREHRRAYARKSPLARTLSPPLDPDEVESGAAGCDEALAQAQATRLLHTLLEGLDDHKRAVFVLAELEQMTAPEIAEATGANLNTVYARLRAARKEFEQGAARLRARDGWRSR
ncbi:RNA polymerase [Sorangium cellulosum]|uniref:RNA polymerase n=1 Tax=Sorangium cellulosum TaxID=56 RepID=A0A2L0EPP7_SORCE|nr:RNA polymerase [Sorangium cellulosum]